MPLFKLQAHIDQTSDISRLYDVFERVAVSTHYTALSVTWWHVDAFNAEEAFIDFLEEHNIEWSGIFCKEIGGGK